ncbi:type II/IV secretion system protein [Candidatus Nomurabacteria bacterium]|uniref:Type II/IV secretion system protein n=1 Tax=Candidatus Dojkabacteria bacterium TaxID=2099670 RepID=A0A955I1F3_9BACT|nr:type II/IV secretion system protein [Candidatus Dojkabacteria bacterium]MCB9790374.1 type II/IV secretion system protein [Candidatus Nomurabacteria bacterium]MCB9803651.1 type II/IV secretion system protein [Candidatus Nomurabacteria bacterium]
MAEVKPATTKKTSDQKDPATVVPVADDTISKTASVQGTKPEPEGGNVVIRPPTEKSPKTRKTLGKEIQAEKSLSQKKAEERISLLRERENFGNQAYDQIVDSIVAEENEDINIGELLEKIILKAMQEKASDVHMEPRANDLLVRFRIDGILRDFMRVEKKYEQALVFKIKVSARLRTDEHFAPQDGKIRFIFGDDGKVDTRVSILPTTKGEKIVMRLLTSDGQSFALEDLGFDEFTLPRIERSYTKPYGMIVAAGPTGSGKTTTLYSILKIISTPEINITTVEDPVEYDLDGVNHVQVNKKANLTFSTGLRSILRQDPDVIMIGEIRDIETARIAINAALTGHLVLSTIHTNDSITTIPRLIDMGIEEFLVASTLNVVVAQRLARRLCPHCTKKEVFTKENKAEIGKMRPDIARLLKAGESIYIPVGCDKCSGTGYKGRIGLYEVLEIDKALRQKISEAATTDELFDVARKGGLSLIVEDGIKKIQRGITSIDELLRVTAIREE